MYNLKWKNKFSGEEGYVAKIQKAKGYFENTFDQSAARTFKTQKDCDKVIQTLGEIGETEQNDFFAVEV